MSRLTEKRRLNTLGRSSKESFEQRTCGSGETKIERSIMHGLVPTMPQTVKKYFFQTGGHHLKRSTALHRKSGIRCSTSRKALAKYAKRRNSRDGAYVLMLIIATKQESSEGFYALVATAR
jgi:hypothetical protein